MRRDGRRNAIIYQDPFKRRTEDFTPDALDFQIWKAELHRELQLFWEKLTEDDDN